MVLGFVGTASATYTYDRGDFITLQPATGGKSAVTFFEFTMTGDAGETYATGGETPDITTFGLTSIIMATCTSTDGYYVHYDRANTKWKLFTTAAEAGHTHTGGAHTHTGPSHTHAIAVTAGTTGDAVTNNSGVLESTGGEDLVTEAAGTGASGSTAAGAGSSSGVVAAAALAELANATSLTNVDVTCVGFAY